MVSWNYPVLGDLDLSISPFPVQTCNLGIRVSRVSLRGVMRAMVTGLREAALLAAESA